MCNNLELRKSNGKSQSKHVLRSKLSCWWRITGLDRWTDQGEYNHTNSQSKGASSLHLPPVMHFLHFISLATTAHAYITMMSMQDTTVSIGSNANIVFDTSDCKFNFFLCDRSLIESKIFKNGTIKSTSYTYPSDNRIGKTIVPL
jgi:hypothetical protein